MAVSVGAAPPPAIHKARDIAPRANCAAAGPQFRGLHRHGGAHTRRTSGCGKTDMAKYSGLARVLRWLRPAPRPSGVDPADVGTAYGMELSFFEADRVTPPPRAGTAAKPSRPGRRTPRT